MRLILFITFFCSSFFVISQQSTNADFFKKQEFENVVLSKYSIKNKTFSSPPLNSNIIREGIEQKIKIHERILTKKEVCKIFKRIKKIEKKHASDINYDIKISFLNKNNKILQEIEISSLTQNIILKKENCKKNNDINPCFYLGSINNKFNRYIQKLLSE